MQVSAIRAIQGRILRYRNRVFFTKAWFKLALLAPTMEMFEAILLPAFDAATVWR